MLKLIAIIHHINNMEIKLISIDTEREFGNIQRSLGKKKLSANKEEKETQFKDLEHKANIILDVEIFNDFPLRLKARQ